VVIRGLPDGILVEVVDEGSANTPVVRGDAHFAGAGQGLYLVQQMAARWGYLRDRTGTTVWFYLPARRPARRSSYAPPSTAASTPAHISARSSSLVT
jgi:hypothetical protein